MAKSGCQRVTLTQELGGYSGHIQCIKFGSFSSQLLITGGDDRKVALWKLDRNSPISVLQGHATPVESLALQQGDRLVAAGASGGPIKVWDLAEETVTRTLTGHRDRTVAVDFHPVQPALASGSLDGSAKIWDLRQRECVHTIKGHLKGVSSVQFTPDGRWLATGGVEGALMVWDICTGKRIMELSQRAHDDQVLSMAFHPHELLLSSASLDKTCKLWDLETNELVATFCQEAKLLQTMAFSVDGRALFSSHPDTVKVWGWEPTRCYDIVPINSPSSTLGSVGAAVDFCASDDNQVLLRGSLGRSGVNIWQVDLQRVEPFGKNDVDAKETTGEAEDTTNQSHAMFPNQRPLTAPSSAPKVSSGSQASSVPLFETRNFAVESEAQQLPDATPDSADPLPRPAGLRNVRVTTPTVTNEVDFEGSLHPTEQRSPCREEKDQSQRELMSPTSKEALPDSLPESTEKRRGLSSRARMGSYIAQSTGGLLRLQESFFSQQNTYSPTAQSATTRGTLSPRGKLNKPSRTPRFLEPTVASRQRALAKATEVSASSLKLKESKESREWVGATSSRPRTERGCSDTSRTSPLRRSSVGPRIEHSRGAVDSSKVDKRRTVPGSPKRSELSGRVGRLANSGVSTTVSMRPASSTTTERKPWSPSVVVQQKRHRTPEHRRCISNKEKDSERRQSTAVLCSGSSSNSLDVQVHHLPSVLGQTAWTVPWPPGSVVGSTESKKPCTGHTGTHSDRSMSDSEQLRSLVHQPSTPNEKVLEEAKLSPENSSVRPPGYRGSGAFGNPLTEDDQQQVASASADGHRFGEPVQSNSPELQLPLRKLQSTNSILSQADSPQISLLTPTVSAVDTGDSATTPAGPEDPVVPLQGKTPSEEATSKNSRELSPLDPNASMPPVSPLSSSEGLDSQTICPSGPATGPSAGVRSGKSPLHSPRTAARPISPNGHHQGVSRSPRVSSRAPDLQRAFRTVNSELALPSLMPAGILDIAAFAAACNVTDEPVMGRGSSTGSIDPDELRSQLSEQHQLMIQAMTVRKSRLQEAKLLWAGGEVGEMLKLLKTLRDPSVLVDILGALLTSDRGTPSHGRLRGSAPSCRKSAQRWQSLGLAGCADLLPLMFNLLQSPHHIYAETCLLALEDILTCFGHTLKGIHSTTFAPGVDLHAEERRANCQRCIISLRTMESQLAGMARRLSDAKAPLARTVHGRLLDVLSA